MYHKGSRNCMEETGKPGGRDAPLPLTVYTAFWLASPRCEARLVPFGPSAGQKSV